MSEDERYRTSTQFRLWSFTPSSLLAQRMQTNQNAASRVRAAVHRIRETRARSSDTPDFENGDIKVVVPDGEVECLTVEEEQKLIAFYCRQALELGNFLDLGTDVKVRIPSWVNIYIKNLELTRPYFEC